MRLEEKKNLLLSDTMIPDLFITEYMLGLSAAAIRCYLYLIMAFRNQKSASEKDLSARLCLQPDEIKGAMTELVLAGLVEWSDKGSAVLLDLKQKEIDGYIRSRAGELEATGPVAISQEDKERDSLAKSIEKTFFHGSMAFKWYRELDILMDDFHFEPQVVYKLFQVLSDKKRLGTINQMNEMAVFWESKGIRTLEQLSDFLAHEDEIQSTLRKLGRRLHRKMIEDDETCVRIWIERLGYGYDVIDFAVRKVWEYQEPSVNKADAYLKSWYASGVRTLAEAQAYEQEQAKKNRQAYQRDKSQRPSGAAMPKQNFTGVEYDEEFLKTLETDPEEYLKRLQRKGEERP